MNLKRFLRDWGKAVGRERITRLPCGCYVGPSPHCQDCTLIVGRYDNPCGGPDQPHEEIYLPLARRAKR